MQQQNQWKTSKEKKFKKPKHLKRKLEALAENDKEGRDRLLQEQNAWNRRKKGKLDVAAVESEATGYRDRVVETHNVTRLNEKEDKVVQKSKAEAIIEQPSASVVASSVIGHDLADKVKEKDDEVRQKLDDTDSDVDSASSAEQVPRRRRGRRRQGRKDTSAQVTEERTEGRQDTPAEEAAPPSSQNATRHDSKREEKKKNKDDNRYCIGRKPVTDFVVGEYYSGKVVYVKPFGIFLDIGCHSDAFCHVSRLCDDFVESPDSLFQSGDVLPRVRVVEIDRRQKRITVSLQSEARLADEKASMEAWSKRKKKGRNKTSDGGYLDSGVISYGRHHASQEKKVPATGITKKNEDGSSAIQKTGQSSPVPSASSSKPESETTRAELKRARKLQRRAERRKQREQEEESGE